MDGFSFSGMRPNAARSIIPLTSGEDTEAQIAWTDDLRQRAYRIRYQGFADGGFIAQDQEAMIDKFDYEDSSVTVLLFRDGSPAATIRICLYDPGGVWTSATELPGMVIFRDEIFQLAKQLDTDHRSARIIEITRLARDPAFANDKTIILSAFRIVAYLRLHYDADVMINVVRAHHMPMYRRLGFQKLEEPRPYPNLTNYEAGLMAMFRPDYENALKRIGLTSGISCTDETYVRLMKGERVSVLDGPRKPSLPSRAIPSLMGPFNRPNQTSGRTGGQHAAA